MRKITKENKPTKRGRPKKNKEVNTNVEANSIEEQLIELCGMTDFVTQYGSSASINDISLTTLYGYLRNPYKNIKNIRTASKYFTNKYGFIKDVLKTYKSLPTLNYHLCWSSYDNPKQILKYEKKIFDFLEQINVRKFCRDGLFEIGEVGTCVICLRNSKYVQFLDLDDLRINKQINGEWVVEFDLNSISQVRGLTTQDILDIIESLPDEITVAKYNNFKKNGIDKNRYIPLKNCWVLSADSPRNFPFGMPFSLGAWASIIQMEIISRVERSTADRLIKQILILYTSNINADKTNPGKPVPKEVVTFYFNSIKELLVKKERNNSSTSNTDLSGTGLASLPSFLELKPLEIDTTMLSKDLYNKLQTDILMNLGVSSALIYGGGENSTFSSSQVNSEKFFRHIFATIESFEDAINQMIKQMLPNNLSCKFFFDRTTNLNKNEFIKQCKELYMQTGLIIPWLEAVLGVPYIYVVGMKKCQDLLGLDDVFNPPLNFYNQSPGSDDKGGRPGVTNPDNPSTIKSKTNGTGKSPKPSD